MQIRIERMSLTVVSVENEGHFWRADRILGIKEKIKSAIEISDALDKPEDNSLHE
jgi:hypothetical protein